MTTAKKSIAQDLSINTQLLTTTKGKLSLDQLSFGGTVKRSEINSIIRDGIAFLRERKFFLPPFAYWTPRDWASRRDSAREIVECGLGWDVTDFGLDDYSSFGLLLFTLRNGSPRNLAERSGKLYAEKILLIGRDQVTPLHFHWQKMEDIINRGGGRLVMQLYNSTSDEGLAETDVCVTVDGVSRTVKAGGTLVLSPGQSVTLPPGCYHQFWAADAPVLAGEVSLLNDDVNDNRFHEPIERFQDHEEDELPLHLLCSDYAHSDPFGSAS